MPRPPRPQFEGAIYHVTMRGVRGAPIYRDVDDRACFIRALGKIVRDYEWRLFAYCEMTNHAHLVVQTLQANISAGMRHLNGRYGQWFNDRHGYVGHVFQRRFHSSLIESERHLLVACAYVVLNPVRAGMVWRPADWPWSSYRATTGFVTGPDFLDVAWLVQEFGAPLDLARLRYREFVERARVPVV